MQRPPPLCSLKAHDPGIWQGPRGGTSFHILSTRAVKITNNGKTLRKQKEKTSRNTIFTLSACLLDFSLQFHRWSGLSIAQLGDCAQRGLSPPAKSTPLPGSETPAPEAAGSLPGAAQTPGLRSPWLETARGPSPRRPAPSCHGSSLLQVPARDPDQRRRLLQNSMSTETLPPPDRFPKTGWFFSGNL